MMMEIVIFTLETATVMITIMFLSVTIPDFLKKLSREKYFGSAHNVFTRMKLSLIRHKFGCSEIKSYMPASTIQTVLILMHCRRKFCQIGSFKFSSNQSTIVQRFCFSSLPPIGKQTSMSFFSIVSCFHLLHFAI